MKIAVLGPKNTYCDVALDNYLKEKNIKDVSKVFCPTIIKTALAVDENTNAILPFENTLDGFVMEALDTIIQKNLFIIDQVKLNIDFAFVTNAKSIDDVKTIFCQFKAFGQCLSFILEHDFTVIKTDSNVESADKLDGADLEYGAIIPMHVLKNRSYKTILHHVADSKNNETRFFIVTKNPKKIEYRGKLNTSLIVFSKEDRPGLLYDILSKFHEYNINLNSILSRPSKKDLGVYNFYMETTLSDKELEKLYMLIDELKKESFQIEILGVYNALD